jgi:hypothetical protein
LPAKITVNTRTDNTISNVFFFDISPSSIVLFEFDHSGKTCWFNDLHPV